MKDGAGGMVLYIFGTFLKGNDEHLTSKALKVEKVWPMDGKWSKSSGPAWDIPGWALTHNGKK